MFTGTAGNAIHRSDLKPNQPVSSWKVIAVEPPSIDPTLFAIDTPGDGSLVFYGTNTLPTSPGVVKVMNHDGSNRHAVYVLPAGAEILGLAANQDGSKLIVLEQEFPNKPSWIVRMFSVDVATGTKQLMKTWPNLIDPGAPTLTRNSLHWDGGENIYYVYQTGPNSDPDRQVEYRFAKLPSVTVTATLPSTEFSLWGFQKDGTVLASKAGKVLALDVNGNVVRTIANTGGASSFTPLTTDNYMLVRDGVNKYRIGSQEFVFNDELGFVLTAFHP